MVINDEQESQNKTFVSEKMANRLQNRPVSPKEDRAYKYYVVIWINMTMIYTPEKVDFCSPSVGFNAVKTFNVFLLTLTNAQCHFSEYFVLS